MSYPHCSGSGLPPVRRSRANGGGLCRHCRKRVALTKTGAVRAHKAREGKPVTLRRPWWRGREDER